ncbi:MAG: IPT/TIG domain-containing protein [Anaeromyxobacteraceae bacterium]
MEPTTISATSRSARWISAAGRIVAATALALALIAGAAAQAQQAVRFQVVDAKSNAPITTYRYILNVDNTGTTTQRRDPISGALPVACTPADPAYPLACKWTSIAGVPGSSPIYTQGTEADFAAGGLVLPAGRYLVSVLADGYKMDGAHFTVPVPGAGPVTVPMQPYDLPTATIQAAVFEDISPVNGAPDLPAEHGLAGFQGHIADYLGEVTTDVFGAPLCGTGICLSQCYVVQNGVDLGTIAPVDAAGRCPTETPPGFPLGAGLVVEGKLKIPNLGPNRYALSITPPDGTSWAQTTTLEGNLDWDAWVMEGATGLDTEFVVAGEPFPAIIFGYVPVPAPGQAPPALGGSGTITGVVEAVKVYVPTKGGVSGLPGTIWGGLSGARLDKPIPHPYVTLTDLGRGDTMVWAGQGDASGKFTIPGVPAGTYTLTWWDPDLNYILDLIQVAVGAGETIDMGILPLNGWWTYVDGYVFNDLNRNGVMDPGEPGLANYTLTFRKRENSLMDRGATVVTTDAFGHYELVNAYPMTQWLVLEAYDDLHYTTGVTYQADNQPAPTTVLGAGVDVSVLPIIGLAGRIDWGKHAYDPAGTNGIDPRNGGIVGTVSYDTTRNELDPRYAVAEDWQPGVSGLTMKLHAPVPCGAASVACDPTGRYELAPDGSMAKGPLLNTYVTEAWQRPSGCVVRDVDGNPVVHGTDEQVLPTDPNAECLEGPLMGVQFGTYATDQGTPSANFGATVDGNFGFGDGCFVSVPPAPFVPGSFDEGSGTCTSGSFQPLPGGRDYLVEVVIPDDATGRPLYKVTREEDINIGNGDSWVPAVPPPACVGPLHVVDSTGNATFPGGPGTSPYEGQQRPLCTTKLVTLSNGKSVVPVFHLFTDVPIPTRFWGLLVDDLNFSTDPRSLDYGEKAGIPFAPVGIYDYTNRLVTTVESDFNGLFDVLLPSTNRINCPTPSGVCANLYRFVGNDPGVPGRLNLNYRPEYRTIAAEFEAIPGLLVPADLAPTQVGVTVQLPGGQTNAVTCALDAATPELHAVSTPVVVRPASGNTSFTIRGKGFGAAQGSGQVTLDGVPLTTSTWSDGTIVANVSSSTAYGPHQLRITAANGQSTVNGLTFHVVAGGNTNASYNPRIFRVGPGQTYAPATDPAQQLPLVADHAIQRALDAAAAANQNRGTLVVVYPNLPTADPRQNPRGAYYENLVITSNVKLQGVGPGSPDGSVPGSIIDGGAFGGDSPVAADWYAKIATLTWDGNQSVNDGAVISLYLRNGVFPTSYAAATAPSIDGFDIRGGNQEGFPGNLNAIGGGATGLPANVVTQGGAIFANGYARNLQITNNIVQNNGGGYGTIRIGTPDLPAPLTDNQNAGVRIVNNRIVSNAGTNLAGGIGIFAGAGGYEVARNDICGNFSAEYGGGLSHYGYSPNGQIHHNRIYFNKSYDEGGGILVAGQLPSNPTQLSPGSGPVDIHENVIQANLANDDGGGIRFLMAGNFPMNVYNNFIVNNVSTHEGGGVSLNDTPNVRFFNNTVMKNLATATAVTSNGSPAPAGLSTSQNSALLQATLPAGSATFSNPLLFNDVFWDNRTGTRSGGTVTGLGIAGGSIDLWDLGVADGSQLLSPTNSLLQTTEGTAASPTNLVGIDPDVAVTYDTSVSFQVWRNNPAFVGAILVAVDVPPTLMGNYHLSATSPARNAGAVSKSGISAPTLDIDGQQRPSSTGFDIGADEEGASFPTGGGGGGGGTGGGGSLALPALGLLDAFNRANASTLGASWNQGTLFGLASIRVNANQAQAVLAGSASWAASFGAKQGAAFTFASTPATGASLLLKVANGAGSSTNPASYVRVQYQTNGGGRVLVQTTTSGSNVFPTFTTTGTLPSGTFTSGDTLSAIANVDGSVDVWRTTAANVTTYLGRTTAAPAFTGAGRIGIQLPTGSRVDNFGGGTVP